jgi:sulfur carrier protein ThiS
MRFNRITSAAPLAGCSGLLGRWFAEAENVPVEILDVEVLTRPRPLLQRLRDECPARPEFVMQARRTNHTDVHVEMFIPFPMCPIGKRFRRTLEMNREAVTTDAGIEGLVAKVQLESKPCAVIRNRRIEIVNQKLRCNSRELRDPDTISVVTLFGPPRRRLNVRVD